MFIYISHIVEKPQLSVVMASFLIEANKNNKDRITKFTSFKCTEKRNDNWVVK